MVDVQEAVLWDAGICRMKPDVEEQSLIYQERII
jgi:hypothetical protein